MGTKVTKYFITKIHPKQTLDDVLSKDFATKYFLENVKPIEIQHGQFQESSFSAKLKNDKLKTKNYISKENNRFYEKTIYEYSNK